MIMLRSFLPVGQGSFCLEQFKNGENKINIVYDCGTSTKSFDINKEIRANFDKGEDILIVFISHLHEDHVNGLEYLLKYCNVKNIIFPLTSKSDRCIYAIRYLCNSPNNNQTDFTYRLIQKPNEVIKNFSPETNVFALNYSNEEHLEDIGDEDFGQVEIISSGKNVLDNLNQISKSPIEKIWEYIPFNFRESSKKSDFYKALSSRLKYIVDDSNIESILSQWKVRTIQKNIYDSYKAINKDLNLNSLVLFSGAKDKEINQIMVEPYCGRCYCQYKWKYCYKENGCLYFGDYNASGKLRWKELKSHYEYYWGSIGCIQLPHHGSGKSYNHELALLNAYFVVSAGKKNTYRHPHASVIRDILFEKKYPFIVTEESHSTFVTKIIL